MLPRRPLRVLIVLVTLLATHLASAPPSVVAAGTADLAVAMQSDVKVARFGKTITFTTTVTNFGPDAATGVVLTIGASDSLATFGGACPDGSISTWCEVGTLAPGASVTVLFRMGAANTCCPENVGVAVASVFADAGIGDPVGTNNEVRVEVKLVGKVR